MPRCAECRAPASRSACTSAGATTRAAGSRRAATTRSRKSFSDFSKWIGFFLNMTPRAPGGSSLCGLITTKEPKLESQNDLRRRIDEASKFVPLENLALSPQCGFASTAAGNLLSVDEQWKK